MTEISCLSPTSLVLEIEVEPNGARLGGEDAVVIGVGQIERRHVFQGRVIVGQIGQNSETFQSEPDLTPMRRLASP